MWVKEYADLPHALQELFPGRAADLAIINRLEEDLGSRFDEVLAGRFLERLIGRMIDINSSSK